MSSATNDDGTETMMNMRSCHHNNTISLWQVGSYSNLTSKGKKNLHSTIWQVHVSQSIWEQYYHAHYYLPHPNLCSCPWFMIPFCNNLAAWFTFIYFPFSTSLLGKTWWQSSPSLSPVCTVQFNQSIKFLYHPSWFCASGQFSTPYLKVTKN